jgi:hypothetical protein
MSDCMLCGGTGRVKHITYDDGEATSASTYPCPSCSTAVNPLVMSSVMLVADMAEASRGAPGVPSEPHPVEWW